MRQLRRHFSASHKAQIVRRHINGNEPVSNLAGEFGLQPSQIHTWVKQVLDQAERAWERPGTHPVPRAPAGGLGAEGRNHQNRRPMPASHAPHRFGR